MESKNPDDLEAGEVDEIMKEIFKPQSGRVCLYGRGVTPTTLQMKRSSTKSSVKLPSECMESLKLSLDNEMQQKLEMEKVVLEQKWHNTISLLFKKLVEANPGLKIGADMFETLFQVQSHENAYTRTQVPIIIIYDVHKCLRLLL